MNIVSILSIVIPAAGGACAFIWSQIKASKKEKSLFQTYLEKDIEEVAQKLIKAEERIQTLVDERADCKQQIARLEAKVDILTLQLEGKD
jgi:septal ring factor EnvC (AmiA/AmiB activator)